MKIVEISARNKQNVDIASKCTHPKQGEAQQLHIQNHVTSTLILNRPEEMQSFYVGVLPRRGTVIEIGDLDHIIAAYIGAYSSALFA